jgi:hypothetical protein
MAFTLGKKGTKRIPRDPCNQRNAHPNPGGGGNPPSDPSPLQAPGAGGGIPITVSSRLLLLLLLQGEGMLVLVTPWLQLLFLLLPPGPRIRRAAIRPRGRRLTVVAAPYPPALLPGLLSLLLRGPPAPPASLYDCLSSYHLGRAATMIARAIRGRIEAYAGEKSRAESSCSSRRSC